MLQDSDTPGDAEFVVFGSEVSGHSYKVCLYLALHGVAYRYRHVDIFADPARRGAAFAAAARFGEVPVLQHQGANLCQSNAILSYLDRVVAGRDCPALERQRIEEWLYWEMSRLSLGVANLRFIRRFAPDTDAGVAAHYEQRALSALGTLDQALTGRAFLVGEAPDIADISCCGYLYWAHEAGIELADYPHVAAWLDRIAERPGWRHPDVLLAAERASAA